MEERSATYEDDPASTRLEPDGREGRPPFRIWYLVDPVTWSDDCRLSSECRDRSVPRPSYASLIPSRLPAGMRSPPGDNLRLPMWGSCKREVAPTNQDVVDFETLPDRVSHFAAIRVLQYICRDDLARIRIHFRLRRVSRTYVGAWKDAVRDQYATDRANDWQT